MLNPLPILFLAPLGYFILRVGVSIILINLTLKHLSVRRSLTLNATEKMGALAGVVIWFLIIGEFSIAIFLAFGAYTQYAAIALFLMSFDLSITRSIINHPSIPARSFYFLLCFIALALLFTGAGAFAVDLPL